MARQRFTAEFKREAVRLLERGGKPVTQLATELGVPRNRLYKWRDALRAHGTDAFPGPGRRSPQQLELTKNGVRFTYPVVVFDLTGRKKWVRYSFRLPLGAREGRRRVREIRCHSRLFQTSGRLS